MMAQTSLPVKKVAKKSNLWGVELVTTLSLGKQGNCHLINDSLVSQMMS
jgi:hypothetical protein